MNGKSWNGLPSCEEINRIDIVSYLATIGHVPQKMVGDSYWYLSPLRTERTASFKVNRRLNRWRDFGTGEGKTLVDFGVKYFDCTIKELLLKFSTPIPIVSFVAQKNPSETEPIEASIKLVEIRAIDSPGLVHYLRERRIALNVAQKYCCEVVFQIRNREYYAIGFRNSSGGYELRSKYFKGSSAPKDCTWIRNGSTMLAVFEGFFDFLSWLTIFKSWQNISTDFLVLNSISFFEKCLPEMGMYNEVQLYLDNDLPGKRCALSATTRSKIFSDKSYVYQNYKDLNDWLCRMKLSR